LRLTNHQRGGIVAAYEVLSSQLNTAQQAFGGGAQKPSGSSATVAGSTGANMVRSWPPRLLSNRISPALA
jgi:hypothetical protein